MTVFEKLARANGVDKPLEIKRLKEQLADSDYKITKCNEYYLAGLEMPYDIQALHAEREQMRARINELESK